MACLSNYMEQQLLDHLFRSTAYAKPSGFYYALASGMLNETMTGTLGGLEFAATGGYNRVLYLSSDTNFSAVGEVSASGETQNNNAITFPTATASWGTATYVALMDSPTVGSGNLIMFGPLQTAKPIGVNDQFSFGVNQLQVYLD